MKLARFGTWHHVPTSTSLSVRFILFVAIAQKGESTKEKQYREWRGQGPLPHLVLMTVSLQVPPRHGLWTELQLPVLHPILASGNFQGNFYQNVLRQWSRHSARSCFSPSAKDDVIRDPHVHLRIAGPVGKVEEAGRRRVDDVIDTESRRVLPPAIPKATIAPPTRTPPPPHETVQVVVYAPCLKLSKYAMK